MPEELINDVVEESTENAGTVESGATYTQEQVDKMIRDRLDRQAKKYQKERTESEKLAKMSAEQKANFEREKREKELAEREAQINRRELMAQVKEILSERNLPKELAGVIDLTDADSVESSINAIEKEWEKAVQKGIADKIKGGQPLNKAPQQEETITKEQFNKMTYFEKVELKNKQPEIYENLTQ